MHACTRADFFFGMYQFETRFARINNKCSKQILVEVLSRIAVRTSMIWRPSSYAKLIQPTTQPEQSNPQPDPNTMLLILRIVIVNIYVGQHKK